MLAPDSWKKTQVDAEKISDLRDLWLEISRFPVWDATGALEYFLGKMCSILAAEDASWLVMRKQAKLPREIRSDHYRVIFDSMRGWSPMTAEYLNPEKSFKKVVERWLMHARKSGIDPVTRQLIIGMGKYTRACIRHDVTTDQEWEDHWISKKFLGFYNIGERLIGMSPVSSTCEILVIIDRPMGAAPFSAQDRDFLSMAIASVQDLQTRLCLERGAVGASSMLSKRETDTYRLLLTELSESEVAERLNLSTHTVHDYARQLYRKFGVKGRVGLMAMVLSS